MQLKIFVKDGKFGLYAPPTGGMDMLGNLIFKKNKVKKSYAGANLNFDNVTLYFLPIHTSATPPPSLENHLSARCIKILKTRTYITRQKSLN